MLVERTWAGLDVYARSVVACAIDDDSGEIRTLRLSPKTEAIVDWVRALPGPTAVAYEAGRRCCVGQEEADSSLWRHGSDDEGKFGEDRLKPAAGLSIVSEFVVATAQVLNERVPATDHLGAAEPFQAAHRTGPSLQPAVVGFEALLSSGSCQAAAMRSAAVWACRSASCHMCRMMTLASCRLWHRRASRLLLFSSIFRARYTLAGGWQRA